jgi:predicted transcriptional regulator
MTDKQAVMDALGRLPEGASLEEIAEELQIMASIRRGRSDIAAGRSKSHQEVEQLVEPWATAWLAEYQATINASASVFAMHDEEEENEIPS